MKKGPRKFRDYLSRELKNEGFRRAFDEEKVYASVAIQIAQLREKQKLTQKKLARMLHTTQQTVSRLENPHNNSCSLRTLVEVAHAFKRGLKIQFI